MNIIVKPYGSGLCYCRPDTTWEREDKDFYSPDSVTDLYWTPVVFARISKAGKCIGKKFVSRYFDAVGFGVLLYTGTDIAFSSCTDHTSLIPMPLYNPIVLESEENAFEVLKNGNSIYDNIGFTDIDLLENAVCNASKLISLRIGDFVAVEFRQMEYLGSRIEEKFSLKARYCGNTLFEKDIIF